MLRLERDVADLRQSNVGLLRDVTDLKQSNVALQRDVTDLKQTNAAMTNQLSSLKAKDESVAFFAYLENNIKNPTAGQTLVFDTVETNIGNAYDSTHGIFVAPINGTYHFTFTTSVPPLKDRNLGIHFFLKKNSKNEMYIFLDNNNDYWLQCGSSQLLHLTRGDRIWIEVGSGPNNMIAGYESWAIHTFFSGFLIQAD